MRNIVRQKIMSFLRPNGYWTRAGDVKFRLEDRDRNRNEVSLLAFDGAGIQRNALENLARVNGAEAEVGLCDLNGIRGKQRATSGNMGSRLGRQ